MYPAGGYGADGSLDDAISRLAAIKDNDGTTVLASYQYNGAANMVVEDYEGPHLRLDRYNDYDGNPTPGTYEGLDRFGRMARQVWRNYNTSVYVDKFSYGYDYDGNRLYRKNEHPSGGAFSELYHENGAAANAAYDGLNRLKEFRRGTLGTVNEANDGITADDKGCQKWTLDGVGNWSGFKASATDGSTWPLDQTRLHNKANEIDNDDSHTTDPDGSISGGNWVLPKQDARGNTIEGPKPGDETVKHKYVFDAWNRLVKVTDAADAVIAEYRYDPLNRRIRKFTEPSEGNWTVREYYYKIVYQRQSSRPPKYAKTYPPLHGFNQVLGRAARAHWRIRPVPKDSDQLQRKRMNSKHSHLSGGGITRRRFLGAGAAAAGMIALPRAGLIAADAPAGADAAEREKIEAALPAKAPAAPRKPRRLLIFDLNVGYGGHPSARTANLAFTLMGAKTGAFDTVVSRDPAVFRPESLKNFDAVFFNNTVGNLFEDPALRRSLVEFVYAGGGLMGVHGTSVAFTRWPEGAKEDWPEFGLMLGVRGAFHYANTEHVFMNVEDPDHPLTRCFGGQQFDFRDEFFRPQDPYSRARDRVLLSIDTAKTDISAYPQDRRRRADNDYAAAWVRNYGRGRVFYSTIAHNPYVFWERKMLEFYLGAAQFVLGDLAAPTVPSARLTPAVRAQEKLGWRLGIEAYTFSKFTFFEAIEKTAQLGLPFMGGLSFQKVSPAVAKNFDPQLSDDELREVRLKLAAAGVRLMTYYIPQVPGDAAGCRKVFEFARKIGVETIVSEPPPEALDTVEKFCDEFDINLAIHNHDQKLSPQYWQPEGVLKACQGRSRRIGACPDLGYWMRSGIDPLKSLQTLKDRIIALHVHDLSELGPQGHDVPWGTGVGKTEEFIREVHRLGIRPTMFGIEHAYNWLESMPEVARSVEFFGKLSLALAK